MTNILEFRGYGKNSIFIFIYNQDTTKRLAFDTKSLMPYNSELYIYGLSIENRNLTNSVYILCPWCLTQKFLAIEAGTHIWSQSLNEIWVNLSLQLHGQTLRILDPLGWESGKRPCTKGGDPKYCFAKYRMINELAIKHFNFTPSSDYLSKRDKLTYIYPLTVLMIADGRFGELTQIYDEKDMQIVFYCESISKYKNIALRLWLEPFNTEIWVLLIILFPLASLFAFKPITFHLYNL